MHENPSLSSLATIEFTLKWESHDDLILLCTVLELIETLFSIH